MAQPFVDASKRQLPQQQGDMPNQMPSTIGTSYHNAPTGTADQRRSFPNPWPGVVPSPMLDVSRSPNLNVTSLGAPRSPNMGSSNLSNVPIPNASRFNLGASTSPNVANAARTSQGGVPVAGTGVSAPAAFGNMGGVGLPSATSFDTMASFTPIPHHHTLRTPSPMRVGSNTGTPQTRSVGLATSGDSRQAVQSSSYAGASVATSSGRRISAGTPWTGGRVGTAQANSTLPEGLPEGSVMQSATVVSSNVIREEFLQPPPEEETISYVQYNGPPIVEEKTTRIPRSEVFEINTTVPVKKVEYRDKIVEVPEVHYVDRPISVPAPKRPRRKEVVYKEVVKEIPKIVKKRVEQEVEVDEIIEVPRPYQPLIQNKILVPRYVDKEVATVVAQRLLPVVSEARDIAIDVEMKEYNPYLVPIEVLVPKPVLRNLVAVNKTQTHHTVDIEAAHFNALVRQMNMHVSSEENFSELYVSDGRGIPMLHGTNAATVVPPVTEEWRTTHQPGQLHIRPPFVLQHNLPHQVTFGMPRNEAAETRMR